MCLAPMEGVTDTVFRQVVVRAGAPDVFFSEFTGVEQLYSRGYYKMVENLEYTEDERPLVLQIWGGTPALYEAAGELAVGLGFDGVDINMGCPDKSIMARGSGSALVKNWPLAGELIAAVKTGVQGQIPVSVKIRLGYTQNVVEEWSEFLLGQGIEALSVHGRTTKEMSRVAANWEAIGSVVAVRDRLGVETVVIGNGDVKSVAEAMEKVAQYGVDGVMIGRGIFENPWLFGAESTKRHGKAERLELLRYHLKLWEETWGEAKHYDRIKRFYKVYLAGFRGSAKLRDELMRTKRVEEAWKLIGYRG